MRVIENCGTFYRRPGATPSVVTYTYALADAGATIVMRVVDHRDGSTEHFEATVDDPDVDWSPLDEQLPAHGEWFAASVQRP